jgi:hypothetical protein
MHVRQKPFLKSAAIVGLFLAAPLWASQSAQAFDLTFYFAGVRGAIKGLAANQAGQTTNPPTSVEVTDSPIGGLGVYTNSSGSFSTSSTSITAADWIGLNGTDVLELNFGPLGSPPSKESEFIVKTPVAVTGVRGYLFIPDPVPTPIPFLGAAAAFRYSRRLKKLIKNRSKLLSPA